MNKDQRKFLVDFIEKEGRKLLEEHDRTRPREPSLNNYIVAAILDGSFELRPRDEIERAIRERVLALGPGDTFVSKQDRHYYGKRDTREEAAFVTLDVRILLTMPPQYQQEQDQYDAQLVAWKTKRREIEDIQKTLTIKVQIGSDKALTTLIEQADNLGDLRLVSSRLQLEHAEEKP